jgi:hypothetical protein
MWSRRIAGITARAAGAPIHGSLTAPLLLVGKPEPGFSEFRPRCLDVGIARALGHAKALFGIPLQFGQRAHGVIPVSDSP